MTILAHAIFRNAFSSKFVCQLESRDALRYPTCPICFELFAQNSSPLYIPCLFLQPTLRTHTLSPVLTEWCCQNCVYFISTPVSPFSISTFLHRCVASHWLLLTFVLTERGIVYVWTYISSVHLPVWEVTSLFSHGNCNVFFYFECTLEFYILLSNIV